MEVETKMWKGNNRGTGFIRIPEKSSNFNLNENVKIKIRTEESCYPFYGRIKDYKGFIGVYVPKNICFNNDLIGKKIKICLEKIKGFYSKLSSDGKLYIPISYAKKMKLNKNDIVLVETKINNLNVKKFCEIKKRERIRKTEYFCMFSPKFKEKDGIFVIKRILKRGSKLSGMIRYALKNLNYGIIDNDIIIIFYHN